MKKKIVKKSFGIALCKYDGGKLNILMIKKRYTYQFFEFVYGRYRKTKTNTKHLMYLFNNMTYAEKLCILNMKFDDMWYKIWLNNPERSSVYGYHHIKKGRAVLNPKNYDQDELTKYYKNRTQFETSFKKDSGRRLFNLINTSRNVDTPWEIPKGHRNKGEKDLNAAKREFEEETGTDPKNYTILWHVDPIVVSHQIGYVTYKYYYYIAKAENKWNPKISFKKYTQVVEAESIKWINKENIKLLQLSVKYKKRLMKYFKMIEETFKKNVKYTA